MDRSKYPSDWSKRRITLFNRYDWECQDCGNTVPQEADRELHAHHVRPIKDGGSHSLDNLLPLCRTCHAEIHESDMESDLHPQRRYTCCNCNLSYIEGTGAKGSFCSDYCWRTHKAEKQLNRIHQDTTVCSTCFSKFPHGADVCPKCGNWDSTEEHREQLDQTYIDEVNLVRNIIQAFNHDE